MAGQGQGARVPRRPRHGVAALCPCRGILRTQARDNTGNDVELGIDAVAKVSGIALVVNWKVLWGAEVRHRSCSISRTLSTRRGARSGPRCRRKNKAARAAKPALWRRPSRRRGWLPPSVEHRIVSVLRWVGEALRYASADAAPVTVHVDTSAFDSHNVLDPGVEGSACQ